MIVSELNDSGIGIKVQINLSQALRPNRGLRTVTSAIFILVFLQVLREILYKTPMDLADLINNKILENEINFYAPEGKKVDSIQFKKDFVKLRNYFSQLAPNTGIGILLPKDQNYFMVMMASMTAGVFYVPMSDNYPESRIEQIKEQTNLSLLITKESLAKILSLEEQPYKELNFSPNDSLYKMCTSGSTGRPKAVDIPRSAFTHFCHWVQNEFKSVTSSDRLSQVTEFTFDISLCDVALFLTSGCEIYFSQFKGNIFHLAYEIETHKITVLNTVVNNLNMLLDEKIISRSDYSSLKIAIASGARFSNGLYLKCMEFLKDREIYNGYGPTEMTIFTHYKKMNFDETDTHNKTTSIGKPLGSNTSIIVKDNKEVATLAKGEVLLGGDGMMLGYSNDIEKTAEAFTIFNGSKYYRSGDIGYKNNNGDYFVTGRMDDTIKFRGYRINLLDVDSYIVSRRYVQDAVSIAVEDEIYQNKTICFIITKQEITVKEIKKDLADVLLSYQIPQKIIILETLPTNSSGKVCKKTLKENFIQNIYK